MRARGSCEVRRWAHIQGPSESKQPSPFYQRSGPLSTRTPEDLLTTRERLFNLKRLINLRLGVTAADDTLPPRLRQEPRPSGSAAGVLPDLEPMLAEYYALRGWDRTGVPTGERLDAPGLKA